MATLKFYLDKRARLRDGLFPLKLKITHKGQGAFFSLDVRLSPENWDDVRQRVVILQNKQNINNYITRRRVEIEDALQRLETAGRLRGLTASQIKDAIIRELDPEETPPVLFAEHFDAFGKSRNRPRTRGIYNATLEIMRKYDKDLQRLTFDDVDIKWLQGLDAYLCRTGHSTNGRNIHFRNIRAAFNSAIDDEITTAYPFRKFKIRPEQTRKRNITRDELRAVISADVPAWAQKYVDAFALSFYLIGINSVDLLSLRPDDYNGERLSYRRAKTGKIYDIRVEPEAAVLLEKYKGKGLLLSFAEGMKTYTHFADRCNNFLHTLRDGLTMYYARHTWATIAAGLDIPKETIAAALGHGGASVTDIYIAFDQRKVDDANRAVLDYVK